MRSTPPPQNQDLHSNVPDTSPAVLLLVDVINDLDFPDNEWLLKHAPVFGRTLASLKSRARRAGIPTIYVNDNRGRWRSDFSAVLKHCLRPQSPGRKLVRMLVPRSDDYIVLKPKHDAFYATPLDTLLSYMQAKKVILAGLTTNACVLSTAMELHVRDFEIVVPSDCVCGLDKQDHERALAVMRTSFGARICPAAELRMENFSRGVKKYREERAA
jgi:nicotinamidase-related amidase